VPRWARSQSAYSSATGFLLRLLDEKQWHASAQSECPATAKQSLLPGDGQSIVEPATIHIRLRPL